MRTYDYWRDQYDRTFVNETKQLRSAFAGRDHEFAGKHKNAGKTLTPTESLQI